MHSLMNTCSQSVSQSVFYQVLNNAVSDDVFKRKCLMENISRIGTEKHMWTCGFYSIKHICSYKRQEF